MNTRLDRIIRGLPGGIPADAFSEADAQQAVGKAESILTFVESRISSG